MARWSIVVALFLSLVPLLVTSETVSAEVPLCKNVKLSLQSGREHTPDPEDLLPAPLEDYSEVLGLTPPAMTPVPPDATPVASIIDAARTIGISIAAELLETMAAATGNEIPLVLSMLAQPAPDPEGCAIEMHDSQFRPRLTVVREGTEVFWYNRGGQPHRAMPESRSGICNFDTGRINPEKNKSHEFDEPAESPCSFSDPAFVGLTHRIIVCSPEIDQILCSYIED